MENKVALIEIPVSDIDPIKSFVAKALNLPSGLNDFWDITDKYPKGENPQLALAHYNKDFDPYNRYHEPLRRVRGLVVDLATGAVVCDSYGHTQSLPCHEPLTDDLSDINVPTEVAMYINSYELSPEENVKITVGTRKFNKATTKLFLGYEGAMVRIFKWNNKVFFSTHRRIDASVSDWGGRRKFSELYKELNGPQPESFFGQEPYSPYCYMLLIAHNEIRLATSTSDNRIIYIGMKKVWDSEIYACSEGPYAWHEEFPINIPIAEENSFTFSNDHKHSLIIQPDVDVEKANKFLFPSRFAMNIPDKEYKAKENEIVVEYNNSSVSDIYFQQNGPVNNEELSGGDFIIIYTQTSEGATIVYRLESPAFEYRVKITNNDPNLYHRFATEMVNFTKAEPKDLLSQFPHYVTEKGKEMSLTSISDRQSYWWSLFYDAVAPIYKDEVDGFLKRYTKDVDNLAKFILNEYSALKEKFTDEKSEERKRVSPKTQGRFDDIYNIGTNIREKGQSSLQTTRNLLYKETGPSLYHMITTVKNLEKLKAKSVAK
jgi:hypothetical protein